MYYIYILYSERADKYYVGYTNNYTLRFQQHNTADRNTFTAKYRPWILKAVFKCSDIKGIAIKMERFIKKQKNRQFLDRLIKSDPFNHLIAQLVRVPNLRD